MNRRLNKCIQRINKKLCPSRLTSAQKRRLMVVLGFLRELVFHVLVQNIFKVDYRRNREVYMRTDFNILSHVEEVGPHLFRRLYRLNVRQFRILCDLLQPYLQRSKSRRNCRGATPSIEKMLCVTLRILAGASYLDVGWPYGIGVATTYTIVDETLDGLNKVLPSMAFPTTESQCRFQSTQFRGMRKSPISGIVAAIDGIAIAISQPDLRDTPDPRKYYNRKGFYSVCVQAAVGADYKFLFVSARHAGGTHDSTAFQATKLHDLIESNSLPPWAFIAADDAYSNGMYIVTPYSGSNLSVMKDTFNFYLSSCRMAVEQAFGILVSRFGIFWSLLRFSLAKNTLVIMVACKLHNFIIDNKEDNEFSDIGLAEENNVRGEPIVHLQNLLHTQQSEQRSRQRRRDNSARREYIAERLTALGYVRPRTRR